jgi:hypothetical protein
MAKAKSLYLRVQIILWSFVLSFAVAVFFLAYIVHELSHALACYLFNIPFAFYFDHVVPLVAPTGISAIVIGLAGGLGEALSSLLCFYAITHLEKRGQNWFFASIGLELGFLTVAVIGFANSIWEGFFHANYESMLNDQTVVFWLFVPALLVSLAYIMKRYRRNYPLLLSQKPKQ